MKKFLLSAVAALMLCFAAPQTADAARHRGYEVISHDFIAVYTWDDNGYFGYQVITTDGEVCCTYDSRYGWDWGDTEWM